MNSSTPPQLQTSHPRNIELHSTNKHFINDYSFLPVEAPTQTTYTSLPSRRKNHSSSAFKMIRIKTNPFVKYRYLAMKKMDRQDEQKQAVTITNAKPSSDHSVERVRQTQLPD